MTLDKYYGDTEAMKAAQEYARERKEREQKNAEAEEATSKDVNNSPVVLLVNSIIEQAARLRASDIHIEALEIKSGCDTELMVRFMRRQHIVYICFLQLLHDLKL